VEEFKIGLFPSPKIWTQSASKAAGLEADERTNEPAGGNLPAERLITHYEEAKEDSCRFVT
jgi:hypothetical protein